jgi:hypothetical protein
MICPKCDNETDTCPKCGEEPDEWTSEGLSVMKGCSACMRSWYSSGQETTKETNALLWEEWDVERVEFYLDEIKRLKKRINRRKRKGK